jgi:hypothetical protein
LDLSCLRDLARAEFTALGLAESFDVPARVRELVDGGELVKAVRKLRRATPGRLSLVAAKRMVDALRQPTRRICEPRRASNRGSDRHSDPQRAFDSERPAGKVASPLRPCELEVAEQREDEGLGRLAATSPNGLHDHHNCDKNDGRPQRLPEHVHPGVARIIQPHRLHDGLEEDGEEHSVGLRGHGVPVKR